MTDKISRRSTMHKVKRMLADDLGESPRDILLRHTLRGDLGYTEPGVRGLTAIINTDFNNYDVRISNPATVAACNDVADLVVLVWNSVPAAHREV